MTRTVALAGLAVALGLFALGILSPMMIVHPGFGGHTALVDYLFDDLTAPRAISLWGGLGALWTQGAIGLALLLGLFSLGLPGLKFVVCLHASLGRHQRWLMAVVHTVGFLSMAEVVFVAVFALTLKALPGGTRLETAGGLWIYALSVLLLSAVTAMLHRQGVASDQKGHAETDEHHRPGRGQGVVHEEVDLE